MKRIPDRTIIALFVITAMVGLTSCQEFIPPREDPGDYFSTGMTTYYDVLYPLDPAANRNQLFLILYLVNEFDEVIEDYIEISGKVELEWQVPPDENQYGVDPKRTFNLTQANILRARGYNAALGTIAIAPKETVTLYVKWDFSSNDGSSMIGRFSQLIDYGCLVEDEPGHSTYRRVTNYQRFKVSASARLTKKSATFYFTPYFFEQCFVVPYMANIIQPDSNRCKSENGINPCDLVK